MAEPIVPTPSVPPPRGAPSLLARGVLGAAAGLGLWAAGWVLHRIVAPTQSVAADPLFWLLGTAPLWTASLGWALSDRSRHQQAARSLRRANDHIRSLVALKDALARSMLHDAYDAVLIGGIEGRIVEANAPAAALFGHPTSALGQMRVAHLMPQLFAHSTFPESGGSPAELARLEWRTRARHANGQVFDVDVRLSKIDAGSQVYTIRPVQRVEPDGRRVTETRRRGGVLQHIGASMRHRVHQLLTGGPDEAPAALALIADLDQLEQVVLWDRTSASPTVAPLEPAELLRQVVADLQPLARLRGNLIEIHVGEHLEMVVADPVQLVCALRTLVSHELFRAAGSTLRLELVREPGRGTDWMALFVEYPSRELSLDEIEATLSAFERSVDPHPPDADLLALALAQRLAKSMGGHVAVESVPGTGTALAMRVPFDPAKVKVVPSRSPPPPMLTPEPSTLWSPPDPEESPPMSHTPADLL